MKSASLVQFVSVLIILGISPIASAQEISLQRELAAELGVEESEVDAILEAQLAASVLAANLEAAIPGDYAGMRVVPKKDFRVVVYLKSGNTSVLQSFTQDPTYSVKKAKRSFKELNDLMVEVSEILNSNGIEFAAFVDLDNQDVQVSVPQTTDAKRLLKSLEGRQAVRVVQEDRLARRTIMGGEQTAVGGYNCTTGFSVSHTDGRKGITTAGHCPNSTMAYGAVSVPFVADALTSALQRDFQWHSSSTGTFEPKVKRTGSTALKVSGLVNSVVGLAVCLNGAASGNKCGTITHTNNSGNSKYIGTSTLVPFTNAVSFKSASGSMCAEGDSGGSVYTTQAATTGAALAAGMEFGGVGAGTGTAGSLQFTECLYVKVSDLSLLGLRLQVQ